MSNYDNDNQEGKNKIEEISKKIRELQEHFRIDSEMASPLVALFGEINAIFRKEALEKKLQLEKGKQDLITQLGEEYKKNKTLSQEKLELLGFTKENTDRIRDFAEEIDKGDIFDSLKKSTFESVERVAKIKEALSGNPASIVDVVEKEFIESADDVFDMVNNTTKANKNKQKNQMRS